MTRYRKSAASLVLRRTTRQVMTAARSLPIESRDGFLRLIADQLKVRDVDVVDAIDRALRYLNRAA